MTTVCIATDTSVHEGKDDAKNALLQLPQAFPPLVRKYSGPVPSTQIFDKLKYNMR